MNDEIVFKALADRHRRSLLDALRRRDGRTLGELCEPLTMTRYGVMKHLAVLEEAGLITTERVGREKHHYLNPVPIQMVYDRWVSAYLRPWTDALTALKQTVEEEDGMAKHVQMIFIRATADTVWRALTDPVETQRYYFGSAIEADWRAGGDYRYTNPEGDSFITGEILEIDPPHRLVMTFTPHWEGSEAAANTRVTWLLEEIDGLCKLTLTHEGLDLESELAGDLAQGWARIISGMKTVIETGRDLDASGVSG